MTIESILNSLIGGTLIGVASASLLFFHNRVAGVSGIAAGILDKWSPESGWRLCFLIGLLLSAPLYRLVADTPSFNSDASLSVLTIAGLLVGFGSRLGGGCTSGHGICGIARLSLRSIIATLVFMTIAGFTVFTVHHLQ